MSRVGALSSRRAKGGRRACPLLRPGCRMRRPAAGNAVTLRHSRFERLAAAASHYAPGAVSHVISTGTWGGDARRRRRARELDERPTRSSTSTHSVIRCLRPASWAARLFPADRRHPPRPRPRPKPVSWNKGICCASLPGGSGPFPAARSCWTTDEGKLAPAERSRRLLLSCTDDGEPARC